MNYEPFGFWRYGKELLETYKIIKENRPGLHPLFSIKYYLLCRAIELYLKAFLLKSGVSKNMLRKKKFGHNLETILEKAREEKIESICLLDKKDYEVIRMVNAYYSEKEFEYIVEGMKHLPPLEDLESLANRLNECVEDFSVDGM